MIVRLSAPPCALRRFVCSCGRVSTHSWPRRASIRAPTHHSCGLSHGWCAAAADQHPQQGEVPLYPQKESLTKHGDERLHSYVLQHTREPQLLAELRAETEAALPIGARMLVPPEQGQFMGWLVESLGVRRAIEVGVFTGYSSTVIAMALPEDGTLVACDRDERTMGIAQRYWRRAGVEHKRVQIQARLGQAGEVLHQLLDGGEAGSFDFAFIDADKRATDGYYEQLLRLVRPGGVIAIDNVLFRGRVADPQDTDKKVAALRDFNAKLLADDRIALSILPIGDGLALCRRRR